MKRWSLECRAWLEPTLGMISAAASVAVLHIMENYQYALPCRKDGGI